jgi:hypothetical protein
VGNGAATGRVATLPAYSTRRGPSTRSYGPDALRALQGVGVELYDWQADTFDEWLECDDAGALTRRTVTAIVPRRNGKTLLVAARSLVGIVFLGEPRHG